jgi:hypothetical protein
VRSTLKRGKKSRLSQGRRRRAMKKGAGRPAKRPETESLPAEGDAIEGCPFLPEDEADERIHPA